MPSKIEILNELKEISPLLCTIERNNPFTVPNQYFENLPSKIMANIQLEELITEDEFEFTFSKIPATAGAVPNNYFETLSDKILSGIKKEELAELNEFPLLNSLKGINVFTVPAGYFEEKAEKIVERVSNDGQGKVVSIGRAKVVSMQSAWWKSAAAAVIAGVVALSSYFLINNQSARQPSTYVASQTQIKTTDDVNVALASLSDDEIADYLEDHGSILDNDLLIKDVSSKGLPAVTDYLLDDNTLNNYLNKIGASDAQKLN